MWIKQNTLSVMLYCLFRDFEINTHFKKFIKQILIIIIKVKIILQLKLKPGLYFSPTAFINIINARIKLKKLIINNLLIFEIET